MKKLIISAVLALGIALVVGGVYVYMQKGQTSHPVTESPTAQTESATSCSTLWWIDSTTQDCASPKQFCGAYMYQGLQTFSTQFSCVATVKSNRDADASPTISHIVPTSAKVGDTVYVYGTNFGTFVSTTSTTLGDTVKGASVTIDLGTQIVPISNTGSIISFVVPLVSNGPHRVVLTFGVLASNSVTLTVVP